MKYFHYIFVCLILFVFACNDNPKNYPDNVVAALKQAGSNRKELEKVLDHFKDDTLKYRAACFLIANMPDKYAIVPNDTSDLFMQFIPKIPTFNDDLPWEPQSSRVGAALDSISKICEPKNKTIKDIDVITANFLIENIDLAFLAWDNIGKNKYSFEDFCEYVLPYRVQNEPLSNWRQICYKRFNQYVDSSPNNYEIAKSIVKNRKIYYNIGMSKFPYTLTVDKLLNIKWGDCGHIALLLTSVLRSIGIPSAIDVVPAWANRSSNHCWNVMMNNRGKFIPIGFAEDFNVNMYYKISKIYRQTYSANRYHMHQKDVTNEYISCSDISIPIKKHNAKNIYICTFNNKIWVPVDSPDMNEKYLVFHNLGRGLLPEGQEIYGYQNEGKGVVYLPAIFNTILPIRPLSPPIILHYNGDTTILAANNEQRQSVLLKRKYPKYDNIVEFEKMMLYGCFEGSNNEDFSDKELIYKITEIPNLPIMTIQIKSPQKYRYVRYVVPDSSHLHVSEIEFYSSQQKLTGQYILSDKDSHIEYAFDNNIDTYYHSDKQGQYIGFDFGQPKMITQIKYSPRTDNNDVMPNNEYELFYFDDSWKSLGKKIATDFFLIYEDVPTNALFLLHNHTQGKEERIFTYDDGEQVWW